MSDIVRVLRILEYVGPREAVELQLTNSIHGERKLGGIEGSVTIRAATIGTYPEILVRESVINKLNPSGNSKQES